MAEFDAVLNETDTAFSTQQLQAAMADADGLCVTVTDRLGESVFDVGECRVKILANFGVGVNHIDLAAAAHRGIVVTNTPGVLTQCTADLAMTLLLMSARRAGEGEREVRSGAWTGWRPTHLLGHKVSGKTLGIVGAGRIGLAMARRAHFGFGMNIVLSNRSPVAPLVVEELQAECCDLEALLGRCDFVSLHCPSTPETRHLIDARRLRLMPAHAILINTARGDVVDEQALAQALQQRQIGGAGLDVFEQEPLLAEGLGELSNVVLLPHLGSATMETRIAMGMRAVDNLRAYFAGEKPPDEFTRAGT